MYIKENLYLNIFFQIKKNRYHPFVEIRFPGTTKVCTFILFENAQRINAIATNWFIWTNISADTECL